LLFLHRIAPLTEVHPTIDRAAKCHRVVVELLNNWQIVLSSSVSTEKNTAFSYRDGMIRSDHPFLNRPKACEVLQTMPTLEEEGSDDSVRKGQALALGAVSLGGMGVLAKEGDVIGRAKENTPASGVGLLWPTQWICPYDTACMDLGFCTYRSS
jgi:hypothetical protein